MQLRLRGAVCPPDPGEDFRDDKTIGISDANADSMSNFDPKALERTATHEIAHGVFHPQVDDSMKATGGYRSHLKVKSRRRGAEAPPDRGRANARAPEEG